MDIETGVLDNDDSNDYHLLPVYSRVEGSFTNHCEITTLAASSLEGSADTESSEALPHCPICFESSSSTNRVMRSDRCGHAWCQECLLDYCEFQISNHRVPIPCPSSASTSLHKGCDEQLQPDLVRSILSQQHIAKFDRLERMAMDPSLITCPRCSEIVDTPERPQDVNARICRKCDHTFCSVHLDAHLGKSCRDYIVAKIPLPPNTKPCSHCGAALQKYAGCDHVVCPACQEDMCFRCGTHVHLTGKVTRFCTKCQQGYLDHRYLWHIRLYYCLTLPFALPFVLAYSVVMIAVVLLTLCCCGCFGCGRWLSKKNRQAEPLRAFLYVTFIISLPFILMLYDAGYRFDVVDGFLEWSLMESPGSHHQDDRAEREVLPATPTSSNISDE